jgi:hypothetical protein
MPNSINRFPVISTNNKAEDKWFIFTIIAIISLAAILLYWQANDSTNKVKILPANVTPVINQLSSSADEISFLIAGDLLPAMPSLFQLQQEFIPPFDSRTFSNPATGCFLTDVEEYQVALWLNEKGHKLAWRNQSSGHEHDTDHTTDVNENTDNQESNAEHQCQQAEQGWQFIEDNSIESNGIGSNDIGNNSIEKNNIANQTATTHS